MANRIVALVPMKHASQRIFRKNMVLFDDAPLYHKIIKTLTDVEAVSEIAVNTDSDEISSDIITTFPNVVVTSRPDALCGDSVSMNKVIEHEISQTFHKHFLQTHATNPLLSKETISSAIDTYFCNLDRFDSLFSVTKHQKRFYTRSGKPICHTEGDLKRTQDLEPVYEDNSNLYLFSSDSFLASGGNRIGLKPYMFETDFWSSMDIDYPEDLVIAEKLFKIHKDQD
jgi:CMP-N-acetylneuraminic acid synthetase